MRKTCVKVRESVEDDARTGRPSVFRNANSIAKVRERGTRLTNDLSIEGRKVEHQ